MEKKRSFTRDVIPRVMNLSTKPYVKVDSLGWIQSGISRLPLYRLIVSGTSRRDNVKDIIISGGAHGDEPAGVWSSLQFLELDLADYLDHFRFIVFPCVNPSGYEFNTRESLSGLNLNRQFFPETKSLENMLIMNAIRDYSKYFAMTFDLHESDDVEIPEFAKLGFTKKDYPDGFYLYELAEDHSIRVGRKIIDAVRRENIPICTKPILGDPNHDGVIYYPEDYKSEAYVDMTTFEGFLIKNYTKHAFTVETFLEWEKELRIRAHILAITTALNEYKNR